MDKIIKSFYVRTLIRLLKENKMYNNNVKRKLLEELTENDDKYITPPHLLLNHLQSSELIKFKSFVEIENEYFNIIAVRLSHDFLSLINDFMECNFYYKKRKSEIITELIGKIKSKLVFSYCESYGISRETIRQLIKKYIYNA